MDLKGIMAISGFPGLFKVVSQAKNSVIVESLNDGKRMPAFNSYKISSLEDIAIYTETKEVPLKTLFERLMEKFNNGKSAVDSKSPNSEIVKLFEEILPDYDRDRVYVSDIKKIITWYNTLVEKDMLSKPDADVEASSEETIENNQVDADKTKKTVSKTATKSQPKPKAQPKVQTKSPVTRKAGGQRKQGGE